MSETAAVLFWISAALIAYGYIGYPMLARLLSRIVPQPVKKGGGAVPVTFIIAAYNEEKNIAAKIENTLALSYPRNCLDIVVAADGSTDETVRIAQRYASLGVRVLHKPRREGKTSAIDRAAATSRADILFFSDANTVYNENAVLHMVRNFADPSVGGVSGRKIVLDNAARGATAGEKAYWEYEVSLKMSESLLGSIVTADGEIFAMRRSLFKPIPAHIVHDDMYLTLTIVKAGRRVVYEHEATSAEFASPTLTDEFHLKVRYASAGFQIVATFPSVLLNPLRPFAWAFFSHKVLRWLAPVFLLTALFASAAAAPTPLYLAAFIVQCVLYGLAATGAVLNSRRGLLYFLSYFAVMNTAALYGIARFLTTGQSPVWRKAQR